MSTDPTSKTGIRSQSGLECYDGDTCFYNGKPLRFVGEDTPEDTSNIYGHMMAQLSRLFAGRLSYEPLTCMPANMTTDFGIEVLATEDGYITVGDPSSL